MVEDMSEVIIANEVAFCDLDSAAGDGDFGMSLAKGFKVVKSEWAELPKDEDIGAFLKACGMIIAEHCGGASGPIWSSAFRGAARTANGKTELDLKEFGELMQGAVDGIQKTGGANLGDKTLLDALIPATEALKASAVAGDSIESAVNKSAQEAVDGAEKTKEIVATKGRASYLGERSLSYPDAGATALGIIFTHIADKLFA
ncbi:MAG: dihydroxyacetone kinase subunit L [Oscillospiraceae bacterium]|nr:dihydroxyacetone kinase subunit L [Oscillospiraceae bacterium]